MNTYEEFKSRIPPSVYRITTDLYDVPDICIAYDVDGTVSRVMISQNQAAHLVNRLLEDLKLKRERAQTTS